MNSGEYPIADSFGEVAVLFADLRGFTSLSSRLGPKHLVALLNTVFGQFDQICEKYGIEKIKTIGDAYMAVCGLEDGTTDHVARTVQAAEEMISVIDVIRSEEGFDLGIRVG